MLISNVDLMKFPGFVVGLVDDDPRVLESFEELLVSGGYKVLSFLSAKAFLLAGGLQRIDCLISDIGMPVMTGWELLEVAQTERRDLPVILITARDEGFRRETMAKRGARFLLVKPFDGKELLTAVAASLKGG